MSERIIRGNKALSNLRKELDNVNGALYEVGPTNETIRKRLSDRADVLNRNIRREVGKSICIDE